MIIPERRKKERLKPKNLTYLALRPDFIMLGSVVNISKNGLCFQYMAKKNRTKNHASISIDIFVSNNEYYLPEIYCKVIYDTTIIEKTISYLNIEFRLCGLHFNRFTKAQYDQLELYINNQKI